MDTSNTITAPQTGVSELKRDEPLKQKFQTPVMLRHFRERKPLRVRPHSHQVKRHASRPCEAGPAKGKLLGVLTQEGSSPPAWLFPLPAGSPSDCRDQFPIWPRSFKRTVTTTRQSRSSAVPTVTHATPSVTGQSFPLLGFRTLKRERKAIIMKWLR